MKTALRFLLLLCCIPGMPGTAKAQDALVLSGGGARGLAHGGATLALERLGRDPDLVVGTSMGAVVGALYAAGYDPDEIWRIIVEQDWPALFTQPLPVVGPDREPLYPQLQLGTGGGPSGLVPDWRINRRLVHLLFDAQARAGGDFDRLARRFRAVAADLETGERIVLGHGDLALAVRASMAVPGAFAPVRWGERWLIDGGIRDNLPVGVARGLGGDSVVAVDVLRLPPRVNETDPLSIGLRGLRLLIRNADQDPDPPDVLVAPRIPADVPEFVFPRDPVPLLRAGYDATLAALGQPVLAEPPPRLPPPPDSIGALEIVGGDPATRTLVRRAFATVTAAPYSSSEVLSAVDRLYATGLFTGVWPSVHPDTASETGPEHAQTGGTPRLRVQVETNERTMLAGAAGYDNDRGGRVWARLHHRVPLDVPIDFAVAASGHELERWATLSMLRHSARFLPWGWSLGAFYRETDVRRFFDDEIIGETQVWRAGGWLGAERRQLSPEMAATLAFRGERIAVEAGADGVAWGPLLRIGDVGAPTRVVGRDDVVEAEARFGAFEYGRAVAGGSLDHEFGLLRFAAVAEGAITQGDAPPDALPALGDEHRMPGLKWGEARGDALGVAGIDVAYPIPLEGFVRLRLRAGTVGGGLDPLSPDTRWLGGGELGALWTTPLGPLLIAVGAATDGNWRVDIGVGPEF